jgi:NHL repeat
VLQPSTTTSVREWCAAEAVHDVDISNDGLVYVSDRGNKRVQVFTPEGKFVAEQFVGLDSKWYLQARSTAF